VAGQDLSGLADGELTVTMTVTDEAGNQGSVDDTATLDTGADAGTVTVGDITADDVINAQEAGETITVGGTASGGDIAEGDSVAMTINGTDYDTTVDADGNWSVDVAGSDLAADTEFDVVVSSSDEAGNTVESTATSTHTVDQTAPGEGGDSSNGIAFDDADGRINDSEQSDVTFTGTVEDDATLNSIVITDGQGGSVTVDANDITVSGNDVSVAGQDLSGLADGELTVTMTVTDEAGNQGSVDDTATLDTGAPTVEISSTESTLASGEESEITFTFSEEVQGFDLSSVGVTGGALADLSASTVNNDGTVTYTAAFTADGSGSISIAVADGNFSDLAGNEGVGDSQNINVAPVANNFSVSTVEDESLTGNLFTEETDQDAGDTLSVTDFEVAGDHYSPGVSAEIADQGIITVDTNGDYTFEPVENWSGDFPDVTYTVSDGEGGSSSAVLDITVSAVADEPSLSLSENDSDPVGVGLQVETWNNLSISNQYGWGNGVDGDVLLAAFDSAGSADSTGEIQSVAVNSADGLNQGEGNKVSGLIYLEADNTYTFGGYSDDSGAVVVGGDLVASGRWGEQGTAPNGDTFNSNFRGDYFVSESGYYTLDIYTHNQTGNGGYNFAIAVNGTSQALSSDNFAIFPDADAVEAQGERLGRFEGGADGGYFADFNVNEGIAGEPIPLSEISASLTDDDGSETLSVTIGDLPVGAVLTDGSNNFTATSVSNTADVSGWDLSSLTLTVPEGLSGTLNLTVIATSVESGNNDSATTSVPLEVQVEPATMAVSIESVQAVTETGVDVLAEVWGSLGDEDFGVANMEVNTSNVNQLADGNDLDPSDNWGIDDGSTRNLSIVSMSGSNETANFQVGDRYQLSWEVLVDRSWSGGWQYEWATQSMIGTVTRSDESNVSYDAKDILVFSGTIDGVEKTLVVDSKGIESNSDYYTNDRMDTTVGFREFEVSGSAEPGVEVEITDDAGQVVGSVVADASGQWATRLSADASSEGELTATATDVEGNVTTDTTQYQVGTKGVDTLQGDGADDLLHGGAGDDSLEGGSGNDTLLGGSGDDLLIGGLGADVFSWELGDQGSESAPAEDVVQDFSEGTYTGTGEADQLDLADLLQGETEENIADYLSVTEESDDLVFQVSHSGTSGGETQTIRLEGKSFSDFGVDSGEGLIQQIIDNGQLNIDS
jgi:hypothetical protein